MSLLRCEWSFRISKYSKRLASLATANQNPKRTSSWLGLREKGWSVTGKPHEPHATARLSGVFLEVLDGTLRSAAQSAVRLFIFSGSTRPPNKAADWCAGALCGKDLRDKIYCNYYN